LASQKTDDDSTEGLFEDRDRFVARAIASMDTDLKEQGSSDEIRQIGTKIIAEFSPAPSVMMVKLLQEL